jgi:predicted enzyme related to lactoylglutathione lyase
VGCAKVLRVDREEDHGEEAEMGERTSYREGTPCWVDLTTSDPADARAFYGELFGWEFDIGPEEYGYYTMATLRGKNVAGLAGQPMPGAPTAWTTYLAADDVDKAGTKIREQGGALHMEPMDIPGSGRMALAADSTGAVFGLWQAAGHIGAQLVNEPGALIWTELATRDLDAATDFYTAVLGLVPEDLGPGEGGPRYRTLKVDGDVVGGALEMDDAWAADLPPHWMPYFAVEDTDAAIAKATELGGRVQVPAKDSPYGRFSVLTDRQGAFFTAISMPPASA